VKTWITPSLAVVTSDEVVEAAHKQVKDGRIGTVTNLDEAREVMRKVGMTEDEIEDRIHFAFTGEVLSGGR